MSRRLTAMQLAERWGINVGTLANWRCYQRGPIHIRVGKAIRYRLSDVIAYERANAIEPLSLGVGKRSLRAKGVARNRL